MTSSSGDGDDAFVVLVNDEKHLSVRPYLADIPVGWAVVYGPGSRDGCVGYINENYADARPLGEYFWPVVAGQPRKPLA